LHYLATGSILAGTG